MSRNGREKRARRTKEPPPAKPDEHTLRLRARGSLRLGQIHLDEANILAKRNDTPNACIHAAYYAMHHGARAALYLEGLVGKNGTVVESHEHVIAKYAELVADLPPPLADSAVWLNDGRGSRVAVDYDVVIGGADRDDAAEQVANANAFFEAFRSKWRIEAPADAFEDQWLSANLEEVAKKLKETFGPG